MAEDANTKTTTSTAKENAPSHIVYFAPDRDRAPWTRIGAQWPHKNGMGYHQVLNMVPLAEGRIVILPYEQKAEGADEEEGRV